MTFVIMALLALLRLPLLATDARAIVQRSLPFIIDEGVAWMDERKCASCHQVPSMLRSLEASHRAGLDVDVKKLAEWSEWSRAWKNWIQAGQGIDEPKAMTANVDTMAALLLARPLTEKDTAWATAFREQLVKEQEPAGSWKPQGQLPLGRRPARETAEVTTMWVQLALKADTTPPEVLQRATKWLASAEPGKSTEWWTLRLLTAAAFETPEKVERARRDLLEKQNPDGGWGWIAGESSDAYGTGLVLYALGHTGTTAPDPAVEKAVLFLKTTQANDGSWPVPSTRERDKKRVRETSTYWGTAWAVAGLLETLPSAKSAAR